MAIPRRPRCTATVCGILLLMLWAVPSGYAQDEDDVLDVPAWETDLISKLSATQAGYQNWSKGGVNSLALAVELGGKAARTSRTWEQHHEMRLGIGLVKQDTLDVRKADDLIRLTSSLQYKGDGFFRLFNPTIASEIRTQFAPGYNYKQNPFGDGRPPPVKVSDFFSPAIFTQSVGLTYDPNDWFTQRFGLGAKETVVVIERLRPIYGLEPWDGYEVEMGLESRTNVEREIFENVGIKSTLGLFAAFNKPDLPDLMWENVIGMKVNDWLSVNFTFDALYDRDISAALQLKEVLALGISFVIL